MRNSPDFFKESFELLQHRAKLFVDGSRQEEPRISQSRHFETFEQVMYSLSHAYIAEKQDSESFIMSCLGGRERMRIHTVRANDDPIRGNSVVDESFLCVRRWAEYCIGEVEFLEYSMLVA